MKVSVLVAVLRDLGNLGSTGLSYLYVFLAVISWHLAWDKLQCCRRGISEHMVSSSTCSQPSVAFVQSHLISRTWCRAASLKSYLDDLLG
jgi:hypothetical protein